MRKRRDFSVLKETKRSKHSCKEQQGVPSRLQEAGKTACGEVSVVQDPEVGVLQYRCTPIQAVGIGSLSALSYIRVASLIFVCFFSTPARSSK